MRRIFAPENKKKTIIHQPLKTITLMKTLEITGLNAAAVAPVVKALNQLLADFQVYYTNLRGLHWNIRGNQFFSLHTHFEDLYNDAVEKVDEIAERLLQLEATPEHRFSAYLQQSEVKELGVVHDKEDALQYVLDTLRLLIAEERAVLAAAQEAGDEVTVALISDYLRGQEKEVWMLAATLA